MVGGSATFNVLVEATGFPTGSPLNGWSCIDLNWDDLLWATITVGKAPRDLLGSGRYSFAEIVHRFTCMEAYFYIDHRGLLTHSPAHANLDPSEKGLVSYYLGMAMAKIYAERLLAIPWMMHISRYGATWTVDYAGSPERPDLFGCDAAGEWMVAEAKGRSRVTSALLTHMENQKSAVATINGQPPQYRVGSATRFPIEGLELRVVDPPPRAEAEDVPIEPASWLIDYYRPIVDALEQSNAEPRNGLLTGVIGGTDVQVAVPSAIATVVRDQRDRAWERPEPRRAADRKATKVMRSLEDQSSDPELVERLSATAGQWRRGESPTTDGVIVRSRRG